MVAPRVSLSEVKYIRPKRGLDFLSAEAWAEVVHCSVMSTWHPRQVSPD